MSKHEPSTPAALEENMSIKRFWVALAITMVLPYAACTLDNPEQPELAGPSELGTSIELRAVPDTLVSDGFSSSIIEAVVRNPSGARVSGRTIQFDITTDLSTFFDLGNLAPVNGARPIEGGVEAGPVTAVTGEGGVARVRYWAPFRTDQENDTTVIITGREMSTNFANQTNRQVQIFLRAANRPRFPGSGVCGFTIEPTKPTYVPGESVAFTATQSIGGAMCSGNEIARYEWNINDNSTFKSGREIVHGFSAIGAYTVTLTTTEAVTGCVESCAAVITVVSP